MERLIQELKTGLKDKTSIEIISVLEVLELRIEALEEQIFDNENR